MIIITKKPATRTDGHSLGPKFRRKLTTRKVPPENGREKKPTTERHSAARDTAERNKKPTTRWRKRCDSRPSDLFFFMPSTRVFKLIIRSFGR